VDAESETLTRLADLRAAVAGRVNGNKEDVGALRAAMASVFSEVRLRDAEYVEAAMIADVDAIERREVPEPDGVLYGGVGGYMLDFYGSWETVAIGFDVPVANTTGSGVPE
jgi:hypothetical protein